MRVVQQGFIIAIILCIGFPAVAAGQRRRIYILETLSPGLPASIQTTEAFRRRLQERTTEEFDIFVDYLDLLRLPSQSHLDSVVNYLSQKFAEAPPDLVIALGRAAIPFILSHRNLVGPNLPTIIANVPSSAVPDPDRAPNIFYVVSEYDFLRTLKLAQQLQPDAQNLLIVGGASDYDRQWLDDAKRQLQPFIGRYATRYISDAAYDDILNQVAQLPNHSIVILSIFLTDNAGAARTTPEVAADLGKMSAAPVYSPVAGTIGMGVLGGFADDWAGQGSIAADIALGILSGKDVAKAPRVTVSAHMNRIDARQLKRWQISPSRIPADTDVSFPEVNLWTQYHRYIVGAMCFVLLQMLLISALLLQRARRRAAEFDIRSKESELRVSYEQVRQLAGKLINAHEEERSRIARELHDDVGQQVASLSISLSRLKRRVSPSDESVGSELAQLQANTTCLAKDLRDLSHDLHQGALEQIGLPEALRDRCEQISRESNATITFEVAEGWIEVPDTVKLCLYRVAQEALRNIAKHANAKTGRVTIAHHNGQVRMTISDDGLGFLATDGPNGRQGIGLLSMRERVRMLGGRFEVNSTPNRGTVATIAIPTGDKH